jgi:hypothetical protein
VERRGVLSALPIAHAMARALRTCHWQPKEARTRPVRSGDLFGDLGQRRIARPGILEPIFRYRDGVRAALYDIVCAAHGGFGFYRLI